MMASAAELARDAVTRRDWKLATSLFTEMARAEPGEPRHWNNLGIALAWVHGNVAARVAFMRSIIVAPDRSGGLRNLGATLSPHAEPGLLAVVLRRLIVLDPFDMAARLTDASLAFRHQDLTRAAAQSRLVMLLAPGERDAAYYLGHAFRVHGDRDAGVSWLSRVLVLDPADHLGAARDLALIGARPTADAMAPSFVADLFDHYVERGFEKHLTEKLGYVGPDDLARLLHAHFVGRARWADRAVDLGCGTGLAGAALRPYCRELVGVDIAPRMAEAARARGVYDRVEVAEVVTWLAGEGSDFDLAVATDVTSYVGDLRPLIAGVASRLRPAGVFGLTVVEDSASEHPGGWGLSRSGTFVHDRGYVEATARAAGFEVRGCERGAMRRENKEPLPTLYYVLEKSGRGRPDAAAA